MLVGFQTGALPNALVFLLAFRGVDVDMEVDFQFFCGVVLDSIRRGRFSFHFDQGRVCPT
ncbi:MAG: hypothetical protein HW380_2025 [Magnetococcales bacterium]|nr:hypothetical protein [Magnetococcales bacterium]